MLKHLIASMMLLSCTQLVFAKVNESNPSTAQKQTNNESHKIVKSEDIMWIDGPDALPKGVQMVILEGNPTKSGPFTMRLKFPTDYKIPPHSHRDIEHITVLMGTVNLGMGEKYDKEKTDSLKTHSFAYLKPRTVHFAYIPEETIIQLHGIGPWDIKYVDPKDDPRKSNKK